MAIHRIQDNRKDELARLMRTKGKHSDGGGLYLQVASPGQASWVWRHKERWQSIGPASLYTIEEARDRAHAARKAAHEGKDPFPLLRAGGAEAAGKTFGEWLAKYLDKKEAHWSPSNRERERRDHERTFGQIPEFAALPVSAIDQAAKADALDRLGKSARRKAKSWIEAIIRYAETGVVIQRGPGDDEVEHHAAMPWANVPGFYARVAELDSDDARALRFTILTAARTDEVIGAKKKGGKWKKLPATWGEIKDVDGQPTWIIPGRTDADNFRGMKAKRQHRVPLTPQMVVLLGERRADDVPLFKVSSANGMLNTLKANGGNGCTVHGFRSSFEDWAAETTDFPRDLVKLCTAHDKRTKIDKAYQRSDLLEKRRPIMQDWYDFIMSKGVSSLPR
jgi:integrase